MKKLYTTIFIALGIIVLSWFLPWLYSIAFPVANYDPFVAYSPISNKMIVSVVGEDKNPIIYSIDENGEREQGTFSREQRDSLLPQIYFTQLMAREQMPDSINGYEITIQSLKHNQWMFSSIPRDINKILPKVYLIMESMPARIDLEDPKEVFRIRNGKVEFIDIKTNAPIASKSQRFNEVFQDRGFKFPIVSSSANITTRKSYDEGYLLADSKGDVFNLKMQAGRPYMMKINKPDSVIAKHVFIMENIDSRQLGLMTDSNNNLYAIERNGYNIVPLNVGKVNPAENKFSISKNLFNWVVKISGESGVRWVALDSEDYSRLAEYSIAYSESAIEKTASYIFPFTLSFTDITDSFAFPRIEDISWTAIYLNLLLAIGLIFVMRRRKASSGEIIASSLVTLIFGIFSFIPFLFLKN